MTSPLRCRKAGKMAVLQEETMNEAARRKAESEDWETFDRWCKAYAQDRPTEAKERLAALVARGNPSALTLRDRWTNIGKNLQGSLSTAPMGGRKAVETDGGGKSLDYSGLHKPQKD